MASQIRPAFALDCLESAHEVIAPVVSPEEVSEISDAIADGKGLGRSGLLIHCYDDNPNGDSDDDDNDYSYNDKDHNNSNDIYDDNNNDNNSNKNKTITISTQAKTSGQRARQRRVTTSSGPKGNGEASAIYT